jgi:hypothetical protein
MGTWRLQRSKGVNTLLSFQDKGRFEVDQRIEGKVSKNDDNQGKACGAWKLNEAENHLMMTTTQGDHRIGWPTQSLVYYIVTFDALTLHLMAPDGKHSVWKKVPLSISDDAKDKESTILKIAPLVVNLSPSPVSANQHYQWICTEVQITLDHYDITAGLHPRVYEKAIFFLNSKTYDDINTLDKLAAMAEELKKALNPYLDHRITHISLNNTILTGRAEAVEQFLAKYKAPETKPPKKH